MPGTRAGICCSVCSLQWVGVCMATSGNTGIFEDCCLQRSLTLFALSETLCLLVIDFPLTLNHKGPSVSWKFFGLPREAAPHEPADILVTSTYSWQRFPLIPLPRTATGIAIA